jgi:hypothetical protein
MLDTNTVLAIAIVAIYLLDSMQFLCIGEAMVRLRGSAVRGVSFGSSFELGGRRPYVPNPLTPFWPDVPVDWMGQADATRSPANVTEDMRRRLGAVRPVARIAGISAALIVGVAPAALVLGQERIFIASALGTFVCSIAACCMVAGRRRDLALTAWQVCSLCAVALVCLPCAGNLGRALAAKRRWTLQAADLPSLGTGAAIQTRVRQALVPLLENARRRADEASAEYRLLGEQLDRLKGESK